MTWLIAMFVVNAVGQGTFLFLLCQFKIVRVRLVALLDIKNNLGIIAALADKDTVGRASNLV